MKKQNIKILYVSSRSVLSLATSALFFFFFLIYFLPRCVCAQVFSSCGKQGLLFVKVHGLLIVIASLVVEHRL